MEGMKGMEEMNGALKYKDPVCGMWISPESAKAMVSYQGSEHYFCSDDCAKKFNENPENYVKKVEHEHMKTGMGGMGGMSGKMGHKRGHHGCCGM